MTDLSEMDFCVGCVRMVYTLGEYLAVSGFPSWGPKRGTVTRGRGAGPGTGRGGSTWGQSRVKGAGQGAHYQGRARGSGPLIHISGPILR